HPIRIEIQIARDSRPRCALGVEDSRQPFGESGVENHAEREPRERSAGNAARRLDNQNEREAAEDPAVGREDAEPVSDGRIQDRDVKSNRKSAEREQPVVPRNAVAGLLRVSFYRNKNTTESEREKQRQILLLEKGDFKIVVNFQRPD